MQYNITWDVPEEHKVIENYDGMEDLRTVIEIASKKKRMVPVVRIIDSGKKIEYVAAGEWQPKQSR